MKIFKMACTTALALLTVMAFAGASSAMAGSTALCDQTPEGGIDFPGGTILTGETCPSGHRVTHVHEATLEAVKAKLLTSVLNVECSVLFLGDALGEGLGSPLIIHGSFTYSNCNANCTATEENGPAEIKVLRTGHETATVTGEGLVHVECKGFINCRYNGVGLQGTAKGWWLSSGAYPNGEVNIQEQTTNKESGFLCPSTAKLDITTTTLERMFIGT